MRNFDENRRLLAALERTPGFDARWFQEEPLGGGLTNRTVAAEDAHGRRVVVRLWPPASDSPGVDRDIEARCAATAASAGVGPAVLGWFPDLRAAVAAWVSGRALAPGDLADDRMLERIAGVCRQLHSGAPLGRQVDPFDLQARYTEAAAREGGWLPADYMAYSERLQRLRVALTAAPEPVVPCHNDLVPGNIVDDGARLWLIDYEYAGDNEPSFELGNAWSVAGLPLDRLTSLVAAYYGSADPVRVVRARLWGLVARWAWIPWLSLQAAAGRLGGEGRAWAEALHGRAVVEWEHPAFETWLAAVEQQSRRG